MAERYRIKLEDEEKPKFIPHKSVWSFKEIRGMIYIYDERGRLVIKFPDKKSAIDVGYNIDNPKLYKNLDSNSEPWYREELRNLGLSDREIKTLELEGMFRPSDEPYDIDYKELIANIRYSAEEHLKNYFELIEGLSDEEFTGPSNKITELANIIKKIVKSGR